MAENNIAGFKKLMRYAQNLAEYEQGIAEGIIDENVFVIVLEEKVAKFKGETFDWSGGGSDVTVDSEMSDTSENPVQNKVIKEYVDSLQDEVIENEEVAAAALVDLDVRVKTLVGSDTNMSARQIANDELVKQLIASDASESFDTLKEIADWIQDHPEDAAQMNTAITENTANIATNTQNIESNSQAIEAETTRATAAEAETNAEVLENEEVSAAALVDLQKRIATLEELVNNLINQ